MTGLNKDKDKDKRSGEARVSDVFDCIFILLHIANICDGCCTVCDWWNYLLLFHANQVSNSFWVYDLASARWSVVYRNEHNEPGYWTKHQSVEPRPRWVKLLMFAIWDGNKSILVILEGNKSFLVIWGRNKSFLVIWEGTKTFLTTWEGNKNFLLQIRASVSIRRDEVERLKIPNDLLH